MTTYWCEHAMLPEGVRAGVRVGAADGVITSLAVGVAAAPGEARLPGLVLPGLANGHSHAFHRALRGRTHDRGGTFWTWREQMYAVAAALTPARYRDLARAVFAEMVLAGHTVVGEFHYVHHGPGGAPHPDPNAMGRALIDAASDAGIRLTLLDACYLSGGLTAAGHQPLDPVQRRFSDRSAAAWARRVAQLRVDVADSCDKARIGAAIHSVRAVPATDLPTVAAAAHGGPLHAHLSEQPAENEAAVAHYGRSPTQLLADAGALGPATTVVHATHLSAADIAALGAANVSACFCPTTERDLADGIGPATDLAAAGARLTLGSDQHAVIDPFEEIRGLEMHERLRSGRRGRLTPRQLLAAASAHGYASLGWPGGGALAVGGLADCVAVRLDSVRTAGCAPEQLGYAATAADVTDVVVAGVRVVTDGAHRLGDVGALLTDSIAAVTGPRP